MYILVAILLIVVIVFGWSSGMQSYATAQQAQAQIEVAQVAQISAWGNLVTLLTIAGLIFLGILILAALIWFQLKRAALMSQPAEEQGRRSRQGVNSQQPPALDHTQMSLALQMMMLEMLERWTQRRELQLPAPRDADGHPADDDLMRWLR